jgi:hypothetical protein
MKRIKLVLFAALLTMVLTSAPAQLFKSFASFRVITTEHFNIIFPAESEPSARLLASTADRIYEQISSLLGIEIPGRIPVTFSPHTDMFNGYFNNLTNAIILYDTPMDVEWTSFKNNLESLFIHELTHAVSLGSGGPFYRVLRFIFGNWVRPTFITAPQFMVEGVTVSFESLSGFGRANDPRIKQYVIQSIHEGKFLSPFQASGVYDAPVYSSGYYYDYGGLFSAWLEQKYGMEKYAELWQLMGRRFGFAFTFNFYKLGFYRLFKNVYGIDFTSAWDAFRDEYTLRNLEENPDEVVPPRYRFFSERRDTFSGLTASGGNLYYLDIDGKVNIHDLRRDSQYDSQRESQRGSRAARSFQAGLLSYDLDVSSDGSAILVSGYNATGDRAAAQVTEYSGNGRIIRTINGIYKARYFRDGVVGIASDLHNNRIVYEPFGGRREILFQGSEQFMFSGPQTLDNERIVFIASRSGVRELWLYNYVTRELFSVETSGAGGEYWRYMRGLGVSEGKILFSHNADSRVYKLAVIDLQTMQAVFNKRDFSGGVFDPVLSGGTFYYTAAFHSRDGLLRFPETADNLSGEKYPLVLTRLDNITFEAAASISAGEITSENETANYRENLTGEIAADISTGVGSVAAPGGFLEPPYAGESRPYNFLRYMNPLRFWLPLPLIHFGLSDSIDIRLDGGGIFTIMQDPTDTNLVTILAYADIFNEMARIETLSWQNTFLGFPLTLDFYDAVEDYSGGSYRYTQASLSGGISIIRERWQSQFSAGTGYARNADHEEGKGAYLWQETGSDFLVLAGASIATRRLSLDLSAVSLIGNFKPRVDGLFTAGLDTRFPVSFALYGAYDSAGMDIHGNSAVYGGTRLVSPYTLEEYVNPRGLTINWLAGGEAVVDLFSLEIQRNISGLYFNRFSGNLALRNQLYDSMGHNGAEGVEMGNVRLMQSLMLKLSLKMSFLPVVQVPFSIEPYIVAAWKFSNVITGKNSARNGLLDLYSPWYINIGLSISY